MTSPKMKDDLTQNGRRSHQKWKMTSPKMEEDLTQNGRQPTIKTTPLPNKEGRKKLSHLKKEKYCTRGYKTPVPVEGTVKVVTK